MHFENMLDLYTRKKIVEVGRWLVKKNLTHGSSGNLSVRRDENSIFITPSGVPYVEMRPEDIVIIDLDGNKISGELRPSIEMWTHIEIYKHRKDVNAIIHAHPIYSSALAIAGVELPPVTEEFVIYIGGPVKLAKFVSAGTRELGIEVVKVLGDRKAALMANHGIVVVGKDLDEAAFLTEIVEIRAKMYIMARVFGNVNILPKETLEKWKTIYYERSQPELV